MTECIPLLHNMSVPPSSVMRYTGLVNSSKRPRRGGPEAGWPRDGETCLYGRAVRFVLPEEFHAQRPARILALLGVAAGREPERRLVALIEARAHELPLPDACAVIATDDEPVLWKDALSALAVLTKSSSAVWLRAKQPAITTGLQRRATTLLVPPGWAELLDGEEAA